MKKLLILTGFLMVTGILSAQKSKVSLASNYKESGELEKALEAIQTATDPENEKSKSSMNWPRTWEVKGEIYQAIYQSGSEEIKKSIGNPLSEAFNAYLKALDLDINKKYSKSLRIKLILLTNDLQAEGVKAFNDTAYLDALATFEKILEINNLPIIKENTENTIDTAIIYNCALVALNAKDFDKAILYLSQTMKYGYNGAKPYVLTSGVYEQKKDTSLALQVLKGGLKKYPDDREIITSMIQIYMNLKMSEEALKYLDVVIQMNPGFAGYYVAKGNVYDKSGDDRNAIKSYEKAIEVDPNSLEALYNLGVIYYNKGVKQIEIASNVPANDNETYQKELKKSENWWEKSLPLMEKCNELQKDNRGIMETLKTLYFRLKMMDKYNAISEKLK